MCIFHSSPRLGLLFWADALRKWNARFQVVVVSLHYMTLKHYLTLDDIRLESVKWQCTRLHYISLCCIRSDSVSLDYNSFDWIRLHKVTLLGIALHCITFATLRWILSCARGDANAWSQMNPSRMDAGFEPEGPQCDITYRVQQQGPKTSSTWKIMEAVSSLPPIHCYSKPNSS